MRRSALWRVQNKDNRSKTREVTLKRKDPLKLKEELQRYVELGASAFPSPGAHAGPRVDPAAHCSVHRGAWPRARCPADQQGKLDKNGRDRKRQLEDSFTKLMEHRRVRGPFALCPWLAPLFVALKLTRRRPCLRFPQLQGLETDIDKLK